MLAAGLEALRESGPIKRPTAAHEVLVAGIYEAKARIRHSEAAVEVTVPGVLEPDAELVVKNESDQRYASLPTRGKSSRCASGLDDSPGRHYDPPLIRNGQVPTA